MGTGGSFPGVKQPGREAHHSSPASAEVKKMWIYTSAPPIRLHGVVLNVLRTGTALSYLYIAAYPKAFTHQTIMSPKKTPKQQAKQQCIVSTLEQKTDIREIFKKFRHFLFYNSILLMITQTKY
jgi:hypothetical protein